MSDELEDVGNRVGPRFPSAVTVDTMDAEFQFDPFVPCEDTHIRALSGTGLDSFTKIYCACGRIVDIDSDTCRRKHALNKPIECNRCRNHRISMEFDMLDSHYNVIESEPGF